MPRQQTVSRLFRTVLDGEFCSSSLLSLALLRSVQPLFIYLINDLGGWFHSLFEREREKERGRKKERKREQKPSCCNFVSLTFAFEACSIDIGNCAVAANTPPETRSSYYLNILRDTPDEFSTLFIVSAFPTKRDRSEESLGNIFKRRLKRKRKRNLLFLSSYFSILSVKTMNTH